MHADDSIVYMHVHRLVNSTENVPPEHVAGELCGRCGALRGEAAMAAIHFEATMEWMRSLSSPIAVRSQSRCVAVGRKP